MLEAKLKRRHYEAFNLLNKLYQVSRLKIFMNNFEKKKIEKVGEFYCVDVQGINLSGFP